MRATSGSFDGLSLAFGLTGLLVLGALVLVFGHAPVEATMGVVQKIFYFHVPSAVATYLGFGLAGVGSLAYLVAPRPWIRQLAQAGAEIGVVFALAVLITGPLWANKAWGRPWVWEPRLTSILLTFLIFCAYLLLRRFGDESEMTHRVGAVLGTLGLLGIALSRVSTELWGGIHPQVVTGRGQGIAAEMVPAFALSMVALSALALALIELRRRQLALGERSESLRQRLEELEEQDEDVRLSSEGPLHRCESSNVGGPRAREIL